MMRNTKAFEKEQVDRTSYKTQIARNILNIERKAGQIYQRKFS